MDLILIVLFFGAAGAMCAYVENWYFRRKEKKMLREMEIVDFIDTFLYNRQVMFSVRRYKSKYYLVMSQENSESRIMGEWTLK